MKYGIAFLLILICSSDSSANTVITFDDVPARIGNNDFDVLREEYAHLGVHFNRDGRHGGIVREGVSQGDPGNWQLEGTNGPQFLGHNTFGTSGSIEFDSAVAGFEVDVAEGHEGVMNLTVKAYHDRLLLETVILASSTPSVWETITLAAVGITRIEFFSLDESFALDNIRFVPEPSSLALLCCGGLAIILRSNGQRYGSRSAR